VIGLIILLVVSSIIIIYHVVANGNKLSDIETMLHDAGKIVIPKETHRTSVPNKDYIAMHKATNDITASMFKQINELHAIVNKYQHVDNGRVQKIIKRLRDVIKSANFTSGNINDS